MKSPPFLLPNGCRNAAGKMMRIGVLALQGAFREHCAALAACGVAATEVRKPEMLEGLSGLVIPGGESTTIGKLMLEWNLMDPIRQRALEGFPIYGTCAGLILLCKEIIGSDQPRLGVLDASVRRNAFGRQRESFEADFAIPDCGEEPFRAVFIRAPLIEQAGPKVRIMATVQDKVVMARQENLLVTSFHPELTGDLRIHRYFTAMAREAAQN